MSTTELKKKKREFPHPMFIMMILGLIFTALTWIVPAGTFDRIVNEAGRSVAVAGSYHAIDANPQGLLDYLRNIHTAGTKSASICFFIYLNIASFNVISDTGAINAGLAKLAYKMQGKTKLIIPVLMFAFGMASSVIGMASEAYPFIPIVVAACIAMGFDSFTGVLIVLLSCAAGFQGGMLCPFTVGLAQGVAELPALSALPFRAIMFATFLIVYIIFVWRYAAKVQKNPELSLSYEEDKERREAHLAAAGEEKPLTLREKLVLIIFVVGMCYFAYGVVVKLWGYGDMAAVFLVMAILSGLVSGMSMNEICRSMMRGVQSIGYIALFYCFARSILLCLENGNVLDTLLYYAAEALNKLPSSMSALGMFALQSFIALFINASSSHATLTMPLMVPLADMIGITRQTCVVAWQLGDSLANIWQPTGYTVIAWGMVGISWNKYIKWFMPCIILQYVIAAVFVVIATVIQLGPF